MRRLAPALIAFGASAWGALLSLLVVPLYLSLLGVEAFGVIGFLISVQAMLQILDVGLAPAINRELARLKALNRPVIARTLLRTVSRFYWLLAAGIAILFILLAPAIAERWLNGLELSPDQLTRTVSLLGLVIAARWPIGVYQNALVGLGRIDLSSGLSALIATVTVLLSIAGLMFVAPSLDVLFVTQAAMALVHAASARALAWRAIGGAAGAAMDLRALLPIWRFSLGMGLVTITGVALMQTDKLLLSSLLTLSAFGQYMLAVTAVGGLNIFVTPLFHLVFPRLSGLVAAGDHRAVARLHHDAGRMFGTAYLALVVALAIHAKDLVWLWTQDETIATATAPIIFLLAIGSGLNGMMYLPYSLQLAHGLSRLPLLINLTLLVPLMAIVVVLTGRYGAVGGAAAWAILQLSYLFIGTILTHRRLEVGSAFGWLGSSIAVPLMLCAIAQALFFPLIHLAEPGSVVRVILIGASAIVVPSGHLLVSSKARAMIFPSSKNADRA